MESSINAVTHLGGGAICQKVTLHCSISLFSNHWYGPEGLENSTSELINSMLFWGKTPLPSLSSLPKFLVNLWIAVEWFCSEWHAQPRTAKLYLLTTNQEHVENLQTASRIGSTLIVPSTTTYIDRAAEMDEVTNKNQPPNHGFLNVSRPPWF